MRNICTINLTDMNASGSMIVATGTNELLLQIYPLVTQLTGFKVKVTDGDRILTSDTLEDKGGVIHFEVPYFYFQKQAEMTIQLLSDQGNSAPIVFNVASNFDDSDNVQVKFNVDTLEFDVTSANKEDKSIVYAKGTMVGNPGGGNYFKMMNLPHRLFSCVVSNGDGNANSNPIRDTMIWNANGQMELWIYFWSNFNASFRVNYVVFDVS